MQESFFEQVGPGSYRATKATAGPWSADAQHGGPPSALAARELELHEPAAHMRLARVSIDILRPVPIQTLRVTAKTVRPGKRVTLLEAVAEADGQEVLRARGWRIARSDTPMVSKDVAVPAIPAASTKFRFPGGNADGYLSQIDWRFVAGSLDQPGPCQAWGRPRIPLLPGEELTPMSRTLLLADSGSGLSMAIDPTRFIFINVDLTVILQRDPIGEWLLLDAHTTMGGTGTGLAETTISDTTGVAGAAIQTLLVAHR